MEIQSQENQSYFSASGSILWRTVWIILRFLFQISNRLTDKHFLGLLVWHTQGGQLALSKSFTNYLRQPAGLSGKRLCVRWFTVNTRKLVFFSDAPASTSSRHTACSFSEAALCSAVSPLHTNNNTLNNTRAGKRSENTWRTFLCLPNPEEPSSLKRKQKRKCDKDKQEIKKTLVKATEPAFKWNVSAQTIKPLTAR